MWEQWKWVYLKYVLKEELTGLVLDRLDVKEKSTKISEQEGICLLSWEAPSRGVGLKATQGAVW